MVLLITLSFFITLLVLFILCYNYMTAQRTIISRRIEQYIKEVPREEKTPISQISFQKTSQLSEGRLFIRSMSKHLESFQLSQLIEEKLMQAALPMHGAEFIVICFATTLVGGLLFGALSSSMLVGMVGGISGFVMPLLVLNSKIIARRKAFNDQLSDTIILIANALRTGYSFMQAIEMVSREMAKPIGEEFARVLKEMNLGVTTEEALNNMTQRVKSEDLDLVITAVLIQRQVGGNLAVVLDSIANTIRERIKIQGQIKTLTAQGKISGLIIGLLPFVIGGIISIINPGYVKILFYDPMGQVMLGVGLISQCIGMMVIRKIINIDI